ncbi:hypothetical protein K2X30_13870 [bacterium]|jgi:hypothetical protein|nr:hypothetical protein [bacterium]
MILTIFLFAASSALASDTLTGTWELIAGSCKGEITQPRDQLKFETLKDGIQLTQTLLEGSKQVRKYEFHETTWTKTLTTTRGEGANILDRTVKTKLIQGVPTLATVWSPKTAKGKDDFLSAGIGTYKAESNQLTLSVSSLGSDGQSTRQDQATCLYKKVD